MEKQPQKHDEAGHVLVLPYPIQGHVNPMLQFAKRLVSKGLKVTLISTSKSMQPSAGSSIDFQCIDFPEGDSSAGIDQFIELYDSLIPTRLAQFIEKHPAKVLVYDSAVPWALDVAKRSGLQGASFFTQNWAVNAIFYHLKRGTLKMPSEEEIRTNAVVSLPSMPELKTTDLPSFLWGHSVKYPGLWNLMKSMFTNSDEADWTFCNTYDQLEQQIIDGLASKWPVKTIGPTIPSMYLDKRIKDDTGYGFNLFKPHTDLCIEWLNSKETGSVIYVAFGSIAGLTEEEMGELAMGLKSTNRHFLWVVRETEKSKLPSNFVEETSEKGLVVSWSPQLDVLSHRAVGCFMTHCGWNSTLEALSLGVPMITMAQWTDQITNAKFVADVWEVGIRVKKDGNGMIRKEEIQRCVREVMEGERSLDIKRNSQKWRKLAIDAVDEGGSSDKNIDEFVAKITCN